jgi:hypothetical protein
MYLNSEVVGSAPGANPTIVSYNASAVKIYNATISLVHFENKTIFYKFVMLYVAYFNASVVVVNYEFLESAPVYERTLSVQVLQK